MKHAVLVLCLLLEVCRAEELSPPEAPARSVACPADRLVVYKVIFTTFWDRDTFPKQYPEWRPPAQWSKVVGFSHSDEYKLFRMGQVSSEAVKEFAELGETSTLDKAADMSGHGPLLDSFMAPPIEQGVGRTAAKIFLDGNHTHVSLMSKLVPSPDWFVGVDSLSLCDSKSGRFVDTVTIEADPLDAGTDNGFTFTSPNWPTTPQGVIFRITNTYPPHPAGSFHYPEKSTLPTIATFTFIKDKEYELSEVFHMAKSSDGDDVVSVENVNRYHYRPVEDDVADVDNAEEAVEVSFVPKEDVDVNAEDELDEFEDDELVNVATDQHDSYHEEDDEEEDEDEILSNEIPPSPTSLSSALSHKARNLRGHSALSGLKGFRNSHHRHSGYHASTGPTDFFKKKYKSEILENAQEKVFDKKTFYDLEKILETYKASKKSGLSESLAKKLKRRKLRRLRMKTKNRSPRPCKVSPWSDWGPCSKTCGIGESVRSRTVLKPAKRGGKACPSLTGVKWCGSARNCRGKYFDW